jgi:type I restriction enzyme R subunit
LQYQNDRSSKEELFQFERCLVHFAVDSELVFMTTKLEDKKTLFLPFNKGRNDGAGNPVNTEGVATAYLWEEILTKESLNKIIGYFAQSIIEENKNKKTGQITKNKKLIFPRYHQFDVVNKLLQEAKKNGIGQKYLIQHSAGSGKSNSISWLAHQLSSLYDAEGKINIFDSILIITDRTILDSQLTNDVKSFDHQIGVVVSVETGKQLQEALENGRRIIITTIQKFPVIVNAIGELTANKFAIIIDEAHSSTSGDMTSKMNKAIGLNNDEETTDEDIIIETMQNRKMLKNASYFAFTATPKNKTLEIFGIKNEDGKFSPFHVYSMKQAIEEGFIKDVLTNYTTYKSYYKILITKNSQEEFSKKKANKKLRNFVESHVYTIEQKSRVMLDHFYNQVYLNGLVGGKAKAMVVCSSRLNAIKYHFAFKKIIQENNYPLSIITAFSGDVKLDGIDFNESKLNGFSSGLIADEFNGGLYQILICANKFQTGFNQPLLQTMYVDKKLGGVNAVQTLSRLNRVHPEKGEVFILDFFNSEDDIKTAFEPYYKATILSSSSDPNKLNDLKDALDGFGVYNSVMVKKFAIDILSGKKIESLHAMIDSVVENLKQLPINQIDDFKDKANSYVRFYGFIAQILPYDIADFEELYQFLKVLNKKIFHLGSKENMIAGDILDSVEFDFYRNQKITSNARINLSQSDDLEPIPANIKGTLSSDPKDIIQNIVSEFNERFKTNFKDEDKVKKIILDLSNDIVADTRITNSLQDSDRSNRALVFQKILDEKMVETINYADNYLELFNIYFNNSDFRSHLVKYLDRVVFEKLKQQI